MDLFGEELDRNMPVLSADAVGRALRSAREQLAKNNSTQKEKE